MTETRRHMSRLNRIVLDVLKPHQPNVVEFCNRDR